MRHKQQRTRYVIVFNKEKRIFEMSCPDGTVTTGMVPWELSSLAFFKDADEVVHNYDLGIVDILGRLLYSP